MTTTQATTDSLARIVAAENVDLKIGMPIVEAFLPFYQQAQDLARRSEGIAVTDGTQLSEMAEAREIRLGLVKTRTGAGEVKKREKEIYLRMGRAIEGIYKRIAAITEPAEAKMREAEEFAVRAEAARKAILAKERAEALACYGYPTEGVDLANMDADKFISLLENAEGLHEFRQAEARKAEAQRKVLEAKAKAEAEARAVEEKRIREENDRLRQQNEAVAAESRRQTHEASEKLAAERKAREALEAAAKKVAAEAKAKADAEEKARKKAAAAPDADKLLALAQTVAELALPDMATDDGRQALREIRAKLVKLAGEIVEKARAI